MTRGGTRLWVLSRIRQWVQIVDGSKVRKVPIVFDKRRSSPPDRMCQCDKLNFNSVQSHREITLQVLESSFETL